MATEIRVLAPLDGSEAAERALAYLPLLGRLGKLHVSLLSVTGNQDPGRTHDSQALSDADLLRSYLFRQELKLCAQGSTVECAVRSGLPGPAIINESVSSRTDLLLMCTHGRTGLERWRLGSITDKVARSATCNMLVVPPSPIVGDATPAVPSILVPLDGSAVAEVAIPLAAHFAEALGAELHLVQVVSVAAISSEADASGAADLSLAYLVEKQTEFRLGKAILAVLVGAPDQALLDYGHSQGVGLIALTAHGNGTGSSAGLGRVTEHLLRGDKPVLICRP